MKDVPGDLVQYRFARARETVEEAKVLAATNHWNACVNRLYYACFYAVSALLAKHELSSSKHSGVRSLFNNRFTRTGTVSKDVARVYNDLFDRRQESDYGDFFEFEEDDVRPWIADAESFVKTIQGLL